MRQKASPSKWFGQLVVVELRSDASLSAYDFPGRPQTQTICDNLRQPNDKEA